MPTKDRHGEEAAVDIQLKSPFLSFVLGNQISAILWY